MRINQDNPLRYALESTRDQLDIESRTVQGKRRVLNLLSELVDLTPVASIINGSHIHLDVVGYNNFKVLHQELRRKLQIIPIGVYYTDTGAIYHSYKVPRVDPKLILLNIDIQPDTSKCTLVQIDTRVTPIYRAKCE